MHLYRLWPATCSPIATTFPLPSHYWFPCDPLSLLFCPYIADCFQLVLGLQPPTHTGSSLTDFLPWRWRRYVAPKRLFTQELHDAKSQKSAIFIVTAVKTSNLTLLNMFPCMHASAQICACACVCVYVCACVWERERVYATGRKVREWFPDKVFDFSVELILVAAIWP
jgi:hypothetical protein